MFKRKAPTIRELYPQLSDKEVSEVRFTIQRYVNLVWRIFQQSKRKAKRKY